MKFINYTKALLIALALGGLLACSGGDPKFDLSSEQAFEESIEKVIEPLTKEEQIRFSVIMTGFAMEFGGDDSKLKKALHGKTAKQVIAENKGKFEVLQDQADQVQSIMKKLSQ